MTTQYTRQKIAILYDCPYPFLQGGGQKRLFEIASRLVQRGYEVDWYALKFWQGPDEITYQGINYKSVGKTVALYKSNGKRSLFEALYYAFCFLMRFPHKNYNLIHAGQFPYFHLYFAKFYCLFSKAHLVIDWWEVWGIDWKEYASKSSWLGRTLEWLSTKLSHHIIAISNQGKQDLIQLGVSPEAIKIIHNGVNFKQIQQITPSAESSDLVYMGRLAPHKNVAHLIHATQHLKQKGILVKTTIIGDGPEYKNLVALVKELGLEEQIKLHGCIPDQNEAFARLKSAKLFILPSTKEAGASIAAFEANACGLPIVAYRHPRGLDAELIQQGINGYWVNDADPKALSTEINKILNSEPVAKDQVIAHAQRYDWQNLANQYFDYFQQIGNCR